MKAKDLLQITAVATGTAILTVATFLAAPLNAGPETDPIGATIPNPKLVADGVEFTVTPADGCGLNAGNQPEFELRAINTRNTPSKVTVHLTMSGLTPASPLSRMVPRPALLWQHESTITLRANETKSVRLVTKTDLPENNIVSVALAEIDSNRKPTGPDTAAVTFAPHLLSGVGDGIVLLTFSTAEPMASPTLAAAP